MAKKQVAKLKYTVHWEYGRAVMKMGTQRILSAYINTAGCCAFNEVQGFEFNLADKIEYSPELQEAFHKYVKKCQEQEGGSYQTFILNKPLGSDKSYQPDWFVKCLDNFVDAHVLPWTPNYTHSPVNTEVRAYILPTFQPERLTEEARAEEEDNW